MSIQPVSPRLRKARPEDAPDISRLYQEAYRPAEGGDPRKCYPFPQFLEPDGVEEIIKDGMIRWFVAELDNQVIGTMGAVTNIGNPDDRVVECFGLVIDKNWQFHGIGTVLFKCLLDSLTSTGDTVFVIAETPPVALHATGKPRPLSKTGSVVTPTVGTLPSITSEPST